MKKYTIDQSGRSMIEMLGVLAIVGVLSVAGIAGYSKAMAKYKVNKMMDQISTLAANTKTLFAAVGSYAGLTGNERAYKLGLFPEDMVKACSKENAVFASTTGANATRSCVQNGMNGDATIAPAQVSLAGDSFSIKFEGLTKDACTALFTSDWGGAAGVRGIQANTSPNTCTGATINSKKLCTPADLATTGVYTIAKGACTGDSLGDKGYEFTVVFY